MTRHKNVGLLCRACVLVQSGPTWQGPPPSSSPPPTPPLQQPQLIKRKSRRSVDLTKTIGWSVGR
jgi:hypothetical protein